MTTSPHKTKIALILNVKIVAIVSWDAIACHISEAILGGYRAILEHTYTLEDAQVFSASDIETMVEYIYLSLL